MRKFEMILLMMDKFMDCGMDFDTLEEEFDRRFAELEQEFYREFFQTLKKTVELCKNMECCNPPENLHCSLLEAIEKTPRKNPSAKRKAKTRRKL